MGIGKKGRKGRRFGDGGARAKLVGSAWDRARDRGTFSHGCWSMREGGAGRGEAREFCGCRGKNGIILICYEF